MNNRRIISTNSKEKIYHFGGCKYVQKILPRNKIAVPRQEAEQSGYRPCKYCNTMKVRFRQEEGNLKKYAGTKNISFNLQAEVVYVKTEISGWKIIYRAREQKFILYHRNDSSKPVDFEHPELEKYHRQKDQRPFSTLTDCLIYIYRHDLFRKAEKEAGGDLRKISIDKKYVKSVERKDWRNKIRRLDYLFRKIENGDENFRKLSFC